MRRAVKTDKYDECMPTTHVVCTIGLFSDPYLGGHTWARRPREDCCPMRQLLGYVRLLNHHSTVIKWWRHLVNAHEIKAGMVYLQCKNCVIHTWALQRWASYNGALLKSIPLNLLQLTKIFNSLTSRFQRWTLRTWPDQLPGDVVLCPGRPAPWPSHQLQPPRSGLRRTPARWTRGSALATDD